MRAYNVLVLAVICTIGSCLTGTALADSSFFQLSGALQGGGTITGFLTVSGSYVNADQVTVTRAGYNYYFGGSFFEGAYFYNGKAIGYESVAYDRAGNGLTFSFPEPSLIGYTGGALCSLTAPCEFGGNFASSSIFFDGGGGPGTVDFTTLVASPIPEPGTLALVGTGVCGLLGVWRRRRALL